MSYSSLFTKVSFGAVALALGGCSTFNQTVEANALERPTYKAGPTAKAVVEVEACDRLGFKVWEDNPTNRRTLASKFLPNTVEQYRGHLVEYNDVSLSKVLMVLGAAAGHASTAGIIVGGVLGYVGGNELDKAMTPAQLMALRACKNYLDQTPARGYPIDDGYMRAPAQRRQYLNEHVFTK